jgi:hypothetical protein
MVHGSEPRSIELRCRLLRLRAMVLLHVRCGRRVVWVHCGLCMCHWLLGVGLEGRGNKDNMAGGVAWHGLITVARVPPLPCIVTPLIMT